MAKNYSKGSLKGAISSMKGSPSNAGLKNFYQPQAQAPVPSGGATAKSYTTLPQYAQSMAQAGGGAISSPGGLSGGGIAAAPQETYSIGDPNSRIAQVDSTFRDQESGFKEGLEKFLADIEQRRGTLKRDTKISTEGIARNRELGMTGIGEDFAARGLGHSGLFVDAATKGNLSYDRQNQAVENAQTDGLNDLAFNESKEKASTEARIQAAKRDALYRLQLNNNLVTGL